MTILDDIIAYKKGEVAVAKANTPLSSLDALARDNAPTRGFLNALKRKAENGFALIAEIKKASPSKGLIREDFKPAALAQAYEEGGAACLSVLTDKPSFKGDPDYLRQARDAATLPALRKDFMVDTYQMAEARAWGADCVLLIMACLELSQAKELEAAALDYGMDVLVECHDKKELDQALHLKTKLIGVNNRNLKTFETKLSTTHELSVALPAGYFLISESGIASYDDLKTLSNSGAKGFLVGESLMRQTDVAAATKLLLNGPSKHLA